MLARSDAPQNEEGISSVSPIDSAASPFELRAGPYESPALKVVSLRGREAISEPFSFEITIAASPDVDDSTIEPDLLGAPACLVMQAGVSAPRFVRGVVAQVSAQSAVHGRRAVYRLQMVPALSLLKMQTASRVFQEKTVPEIVAAVLDEAGIAYALRLLGKYRTRTYCVQHRETYFAFVERLLAEEGIFYTFDHGGPDAESEIVSLSDTAHLYPAIEGDPELAYRPHEGAAGMALDEHHVQRFDLRRSLRPTSVLRRGYDFRRPALALTAEAKLGLVTGGEPVRGEIYEHHEEDEEPNIRQETVTAELEQHRAGVEVGRGASGCRRLVPGARFKLCDHDLGRLDAEYVVTSVAHEGRSPETAAHGEPVYSNTFDCVPAAVTARPARPARSLQQVTETAQVVGPEGQEIYTDEHGRVKVQFHWDRDGRRDEHSSCWIRVAQAWAGSGWGFQFIPRIGMEVVVTFLGGDVDRPLITGCVPNAINQPPFKLPESKTRSGIRTQSTPGGGGFNELSFQDAVGAEQIYVHAQRNLDEKVENNHTLLVQNDELLRILGNRIDTVEKNLASLVKGDQTSRIDGNRIDVVGGNSDERVSGLLVTRIEGKERRGVAGDTDLEYAADLTTRVLGSVTTIVGTQDKKRSWVTHAEGTATLFGLDKLELRSEKELVLSVGKSSIRITADKIELSSAGLSAKGGGAGISASDDGLALSSKGDAQMVVGKKLVFKTDGASISMEKEVRIDGAKILLNSPGMATDSPVAAPEPPTKIELTDEDGTTLPQQRYLIVLYDKSELSGLTDNDGKAELELKSGGRVTFPDVTTPADKSGNGPILPYVVKQGDYLRKLAFAHGFNEDEVWKDPKNAELKSKRKSPNLLHPGDLLHFPRPKRHGLPLAKGTTNKYKARVPKTSVRLTFKNAEGPFKNEPYVIEGLGAPVKGTTAEDGTLTIDAPIHVRGVQIVFPGKQFTFPVGIGDMDPIDEPVGVRKRLEQLGYGEPSSEGGSEGQSEARDRRALVEFQQAQGLKPSGDLDDATKAALAEEHGS